MPPPRRRYDAQASRDALLRAAGELFDDRGYEATTTREIGERAGVDPALIARYFGGKEGLYLAYVADPNRPAISADPHEFVARMLTRSETQGLGPVTRALVSPVHSEAMREQVADVVRVRLLEPLTAELRQRGLDHAPLRAELLVAVATGVALARLSGTLPELRGAAPEEILAILEPLVGELGGS